MNVDTVEERTEIFVLDDCALLDSGTALGNLFEVNAMKSEVILLFFFLGDDDSFWSVDSFVDFESQEVFDFDGLSLLQIVTLPPSITLTTMGKWE